MNKEHDTNTYCRECGIQMGLRNLIDLCRRCGGPLHNCVKCGTGCAHWNAKHECPKCGFDHSEMVRKVGRACMEHTHPAAYKFLQFGRTPEWERQEMLAFNEAQFQDELKRYHETGLLPGQVGKPLEAKDAAVRAVVHPGG